MSAHSCFKARACAILNGQHFHIAKLRRSLPVATVLFTHFQVGSLTEPTILIIETRCGNGVKGYISL